MVAGLLMKTPASRDPVVEGERLYLGEVISREASIDENS